MMRSPQLIETKFAESIHQICWIRFNQTVNIRSLKNNHSLNRKQSEPGWGCC